MPNRIVDDLLTRASESGLDMNCIASRAANGYYTKDEQMQFAQLIGYSVDGYGSLSYATDLSYQEASETVLVLIRNQGEVK